MQIVNRFLMVAGFCALIGCGGDNSTSSATSSGGSSTTGGSTTGTTGTTVTPTSTGSETTATPTGGGETEGQTSAPTTGSDPGTSTGSEGSTSGSSTSGSESSTSGSSGSSSSGPGPACGDADLDPGEGCDDGNTMAGDGCDATCQIEACDPDGVWKVDGAPLAYTCCVGLVNLNINTFLFSNEGASISSSPSNPIAMAGVATTCPVGKFTNQGAIPGGCTETYKLTGSFVDANTWKGTYVLDFEGRQCSCFNGMLGAPCIDQAFPVTAKR